MFGWLITLCRALSDGAHETCFFPHLKMTSKDVINLRMTSGIQEREGGRGFFLLGNREGRGREKGWKGKGDKEKLRGSGEEGRI